MELLPFIYAVLAGALNGTIGVFSKLSGLPANIITFTRLFVGAVFMLLFLLIIRKAKLVKVWPTWPVLISGILMASGIIFYVQAMNCTSMANAIMLIYLAPVFASVLAHFFLGERLTAKSLILICLALFGFAMMMEFKVDFSTESQEFTGIIFGLLANATYTAFLLINRTISPKIHVYNSTFWQLLIGSCLMLPFLPASIYEVNSSNIAILLCVGFLPGFMATLLMIAALSRLPVAVFGTIVYTEPVSVVIFGWAFFNESLTMLQSIGCLLIVFCGIYRIVSTPNNRKAIYEYVKK